MKESRKKGASITTEVILVIPGRCFCLSRCLFGDAVLSSDTQKHPTVKVMPCFGGHDTVTSLQRSEIKTLHRIQCCCSVFFFLPGMT